MRFTLNKCAILLLIVTPIFSQEREQGLITNAPYWRQALGGAVLSLPHVQAQSAVVALDGGNIRAYSTSGTPMWNYSARGRISPYITRSRTGTSYFSRNTGILIAVNRSGRELWRRNIGNPLCAGVIVGWDGRLFVPTDKRLLCYTASGTMLWGKDLEASFAVPPKPDRAGGIIFALENKTLLRVDQFGNTTTWELPDMPKDVLVFGQQRIMILHRDGTIEIFGSTDDWFLGAQSEVHSFVMPRLPASPLAAIITGDSVAAVTSDGRLSFLSIEERKILWTGDSHIREVARSGGRPELEAEIFTDERGIYVLSKNGATCFSYDGKRLWYTLLQNAAAIPAFGSDGVLYSGGRDWILYAYKIEDRVLPEKGGLFGPLPEGRYGLGNPKPSLTDSIPLFDDEIQPRLEYYDYSISRGNVGSNEPAWTTFLLTVSAGQAEVQLRIGALHLLGQIGSQETLSWLVNIYRRENEPMVKAAALRAIGAIGVDPEGIAIQTFLFSLIQDNLRDEQILIAMAEATGALCRFSGPPLSETGIQILNLISAGHQPALARRQAQQELLSLR